MRLQKEKARGRGLNQLLLDINKATLKPCLKIVLTNSNRPAPRPQVQNSAPVKRGGLYGNS